MPTKPLLLAEGELPLHRERLTVDALAEALAGPLPTRPHDVNHLNKVLRRFWPAEVTWSHVFLVIVTESALDVRACLHLRHGLTVADLRRAAEVRLGELGMPVGAQRSPLRARALHDLTVGRDDCPSGVMRLRLYAVPGDRSVVPSIHGLPDLQGCRSLAAAA